MKNIREKLDTPIFSEKGMTTNLSPGPPVRYCGNAAIFFNNCFFQK